MGNVKKCKCGSQPFHSRKTKSR